MQNQNGRHNPTIANPSRLSFYADQHQTNEMIEMTHVVRTIPSKNLTTMMQDNDNHHTPCEEQTTPASNLAHGSEQPSIQNHNYTL